jgi:hypothetical protein
MTTVSTPLKLALSLLVIAALVATHVHFNKVSHLCLTVLESFCFFFVY